MKSENAKLLIGLGIGAIVGAAIAYLMTSEKKEKLVEDLHQSMDEVKENIKTMAAKAKVKAEETAAGMAEKTEHVAEKVAEKAGHFKEKMRGTPPPENTQAKNEKKRRTTL